MNQCLERSGSECCSQLQVLVSKVGHQPRALYSVNVLRGDINMILTLCLAGNKGWMSRVGNRSGSR
jgi:hypothetical protein